MGKLEDRKQALRVQIVSEFIKQMEEKGYEKVTMEGIAKSCSITKRTLYKYFPVKEAIVVAYIQITFKKKYNERIKAMASIESFENKIAYYLRELIEGVMCQPVMFEHYLKYIMGNLVINQVETQEKSHIEDPLTFLLNQGYKEDKINTDLPIHMVKDLFLFAFVQLTKFYYRDPEHFILDDYLDFCTDIFIKGIGR